MNTTHLLYLHGFRSSPQSAKALHTQAYVQAHHPQVTLWCPQLPPSPAAAMDLLMEGVRDWPRHQMAVMGSSLGGYYASWLAQQQACPSVLINPAVNPAHSLASYIGEHTQWHQPEERFYFLPEYIGELETLDVRDQPPAGPQMALIATGDEVLDWREMRDRYPAAQQTIIEGGEHALLSYPQYLPQIARFLQLA